MTRPSPFKPSMPRGLETSHLFALQTWRGPASAPSIPGLGLMPRIRPPLSVFFPCFVCGFFVTTQNKRFEGKVGVPSASETTVLHLTHSWESESGQHLEATRPSLRIRSLHTEAPGCCGEWDRQVARGDCEVPPGTEPVGKASWQEGRLSEGAPQAWSWLVC